ncbi:hypothetical protein GCM10028821_07510 [Hymenobacter jeollabukensis]
MLGKHVGNAIAHGARANDGDVQHVWEGEGIGQTNGARRLRAATKLTQTPAMPKPPHPAPEKHNPA